MPESPETHISNIALKLQQLLKNYAAKTKQNEKLDKENEVLKKANENMNTEISQLREQVLILKTAALSLDEKDKKAFEKNINQYIRTLDKCIGLLKN